MVKNGTQIKANGEKKSWWDKASVLISLAAILLGSGGGYGIYSSLHRTQSGTAVPASGPALPPARSSTQSQSIASPNPTIGPEVNPPIPYGYLGQLISANGLAIQESQTGTQAGDIPQSEPPTNDSSQLWAFWYGSDQPNPDPNATVLETSRTDSQTSPAGKGSVIDHQPSGSTFIRQVIYDATEFWKFHVAGTGNGFSWYQIVDSQQYCLTADQADAPLQVEVCNSDDSQRWRITRITTGRS